MILESAILRPKRTEEEKARRHLHGDCGARFSARYMEPAGDGNSNTITTFTKDNILMEAKKKRYRIRKLTPTECLRLMGVSDGDIAKIKATGVSESQQYKMAGNSIVVDTMVEGIFKNLFLDDGGIPDGCLF